MNIAIIGASGCVGTDLTARLLKTTNHALTLFSHNATDLEHPAHTEPRLTRLNGDILKPDDINRALEGCDVAVYLVHLMGNGATPFEDRERQAAMNFVSAVKSSGVRSVVYVGGMGSRDTKLTRHLRSREQTGQIFMKHLPNIVVLHTPMIIGKNAAGFEVIRSLVRFPLLPVPTWANGITRPITVDDVSRYIIMSLDQKRRTEVHIGGPETLSYVDIIRRYAAFRRKQVFVLFVPFVPKRLVALIFGLFKHSRPAMTVADMIESAGYSTTNVESNIPRYLDAKPSPIEQAFY